MAQTSRQIAYFLPHSQICAETKKSQDTVQSGSRLRPFLWAICLLRSWWGTLNVGCMRVYNNFRVYLTSMRGKFLLLSIKAIQFWLRGMARTNIWSFFSSSWFLTFLMAIIALVVFLFPKSISPFWFESPTEYGLWLVYRWEFIRDMAFMYWSESSLSIG